MCGKLASDPVNDYPMTLRELTNNWRQEEPSLRLIRARSSERVRNSGRKMRIRCHLRTLLKKNAGKQRKVNHESLQYSQYVSAGYLTTILSNLRALSGRTPQRGAAGLWLTTKYTHKSTGIYARTFRDSESMTGAL